MKVSDLSRQTGVSNHRLRHYEQLGLIRAARTDSGYRLFDEQRIRKELMAASAWFQKRKREAAKRERERLDKSGPSPWPIRRKYSQ